MQIIIPMSGFGERFRRVGYQKPKPLIELEGKPIIAHVLDLFPGETDVVFICNEEHLQTAEYHLEEQLKHYCPTGTIVSITPHKLGPVHAVLQAASHVKLHSPIIVNYCDFTCYWDWQHFKSFVKHSQSDGCIPAYRGFHPHSLGKTNYAYMREENGWLTDIQEKQPYTDNRMQEFASSGTYYYANGALMLEAYQKTIDQNLRTGNEYYSSLTYLPMLADKRNISVYELQHFMQWGTPEDVAEYTEWSNIFKGLIKPSNQETSCPVSGATIVPMAGLGSRFKKQGYTQTKPLIAVSGKPMVAQATNCLPNTDQHIFVVREDMPGYTQICNYLNENYSAHISSIAKVTEGQADSAKIGLEDFEKSQEAHLGSAITFGACDNGMLYNAETFQRLLNDSKVDIIVWGARRHTNAIRKPEMFGWIDADAEGKIHNISVKQPLADPSKDPIVIGTFTFKHRDAFLASVARMHQRDGRINGEFYLDTCINDAIALGYTCALLEVDAFISWGTPNDLQTFEYWQSCFDKWATHPYRMEDDTMINPEAIDQLRTGYTMSAPSIATKSISSTVMTGAGI